MKLGTMDNFRISNIFEPNYMSYQDFCNLECNRDESSLFAKYIEYRFNKYLDNLNGIPDEYVTSLLEASNDFLGNKTKKRFTNAISYICKELGIILSKAYSPNQSSAFKELERLLDTSNPKLKRYLNEQLENYLSVSCETERIFYRIRDCEQSETPKDCWYVPFNKREHAYTGRFGTPGHPTLYLGDKPATSISEIGELKQGKKRWIGEFIMKNPKFPLICFDLTIPRLTEINKMDKYDIFCLILTWPFRILCSVPSKHKTDVYCEEYIFSQLLINLLSYEHSDKRGLTKIKGIAYSSTKCEGGINFAFPIQPPTLPPKMSTCDNNYIRKIFTTSEPEEVGN